MRLFAIALIFSAVLFAEPASSSTLYVDLNTIGGQTGTISEGPCYCGPYNYYLSPVLTFVPGDTVHFGTVKEYSSGPFGTPDAGPDQVPYWTQFYPSLHGGTPDTSVSLFPSLSFGSPFSTQTYDFTFTFSPSSFLSVQVELEDYSYTPAIAPIPEPSTWAMLLLGFIGIGIVKLRRRALASLSL